MSKSSAVIGAVSVAIALSSVGYGVYASRRSEARIAALEARLAEAERITKNDCFTSLMKREQWKHESEERLKKSLGKRLNTTKQ